MAELDQATHGPAEALTRGDPDLHATAMFAPEPARGRLMALYAADLELARCILPALRGDTGPLIAEMRLQWWRDVVTAAEESGARPAHEVAGPLAALVAEGHLTADSLDEVISGYSTEMSAEMTAEAYPVWADQRFGALTALATGLVAGSPVPHEVLRPMGRALASGFALRTAAGLARHGRSLLPGIAPGELMAGQGGLSAETEAALAEAARNGLAAAAEARRHRRAVPKAALPALLPLWQAERACRLALSDPESVAGGLPPPAPHIRSAALLWRALSGRW